MDLVDIHSHIVWGVDDGAQSVAESVEMLRIAAESGTSDIVATPHANSEFHYDETLIEERIQELRLQAGTRPNIHRGCDFHLTFANVEEAVTNPGRYAIAGGPYILVEFPNAHIKGFGPALEMLMSSGLLPIITHPERHPVLRGIDRSFLSWLEMGCLTQVTALSLLGRFGRSAEKSAWKMVERGLAHIVASDAHGVDDRTPRMDEAYAAVAGRMGKETAELLFVSNPRSALRGEDIVRLAPQKTAWWRIFG